METQHGYLLIVEDDLDIIKILETTLNYSGYRVVTARNGKEGLAAIQKERPAMVIADIMMPTLDGFGFVHRLRINPETRTIPVVFITATYISREDREFALDIGASRFIQKPIELEELLCTVEELLATGTTPSLEPVNELNFYEGYRQRLEAKLAQKNKQIARDKFSLEAISDKDGAFLQVSLHQAVSERKEIQLLLEQVHAQLEKLTFNN